MSDEQQSNEQQQQQPVDGGEWNDQSEGDVKSESDLLTRLDETQAQLKEYKRMFEEQRSKHDEDMQLALRKFKSVKDREISTRKRESSKDRENEELRQRIKLIEEGKAETPGNVQWKQKFMDIESKYNQERLQREELQNEMEIERIENKKMYKLQDEYDAHLSKITDPDSKYHVMKDIASHVDYRNGEWVPLDEEGSPVTGDFDTKVPLSDFWAKHWAKMPKNRGLIKTGAPASAPMSVRQMDNSVNDVPQANPRPSSYKDDDYRSAASKLGLAPGYKVVKFSSRAEYEAAPRDRKIQMRREMHQGKLLVHIHGEPIGSENY